MLVTGATGLIGSHVADRFREHGWHVRALVRADSDTRHLEGLGAEMVLGDVTDPDSISGAAAGCEAIVHAAARVGSPAAWESFRRVNVDGTRHVLAECIRAGCDRFVHLSSVAVYGPPSTQPRLPVDEDAPVDGDLAPHAHYERSKRMAESAVRRGAEGLVDWTMLRPAVVMGERDRHFTPRIARHAGRRLLFTVGPGDNSLPVVYAGNVAEACRLAATRPEAVGRAYNVADDGGITQGEVLREAASRGARIFPLPRRPVAWAVEGLDRLRAVLPVEVGGMITPRRLWFLSHPNPFCSRRIREELGWAPITTTLEGWRRALRWHARSRRAIERDRSP